MAKKKTSKKDPASTPTFEAALEALEEIVSQLEDGQLPLADSLESYEQGMTHLKRCYQMLERAERRIELLSGVDAAGNPITEPLPDDVDDDLSQKAAGRSRRRSKPASNRSQQTDVDGGDRLF